MTATGTGRTVAVTGASRGIGEAIAFELARRGFTVGCLTRNGIGPEEHAVPDAVAGRLVPIACDVTDDAQARAALGELVARTGRLDGLVNNAGLHIERRSRDCSSEDFARVMAVNATALFAMCREAYPHLRAGGGGLIVNIGSHFDKMGVRHHAAYCASKAAVGAITRVLAAEWARQGIRTVDVAPGFTLTDLNRAYMDRPGFTDYLDRAIPAGRPGRPEEIARFVAAIMAEDLPFLNGETLYIDGGQAMSD